MPSLGADMEAGTLVVWHVQPGGRVKRGDIIAEVETDKGIIEVEVFENGVIEQILVQPGMEVPVGTVLATIRADGTPVVPAARPAATTVAGSPASARPPAARPPQPPVEQPAAALPRLRVSPLARKLATELGIDVHTVRGTGPGGAIGRADIEHAATARKAAAAAPPLPPEAAAPLPVAPAPAPPAARGAPPTGLSPTGIRRAIAAAMARSNRDIPHYYLQTRIDMSRALRWLEAENQRRSLKERLLPAVLLLKAVAQALGDVPELNGYWSEERHQPQEAVHIGFAIALRQGGLIAPAIHHVDLKSLDDLMEALRDLIPRARSGRLRSSEMTDATITVTNLGDLGVEVVYGVIYPPQVALVGFGKILEQPWAEHGMLGVRPVVTATLAADHRATDGHRGAQFLEALNRSLQEPATL